MSTTPDYGEPWKLRTEGSRTVIINPGATGADFDLPIHAARAFSCVNACAGMADPAAEIEAMREAIKEAHDALQMASLTMQTLCPVPSHEGHCGPESCCDGSCADASHFADKLERNDAALAKLQPFIKP